MDIKLKNVRLSFPTIWSAKEYKPGDGKPRFDATFLVVPGSENDKAIQAAIIAEAQAQYDKKAAANLTAWKNNNNKHAYTDGNLKEYDGYEGMMALSCHAKTRPLIVDRDRSPLTEADGRPYAGCYVNATVSIYAQGGENPGIRASFSGIQFCGDGDAFGGGRPAAIDDFEDLGVGEESEFSDFF